MHGDSPEDVTEPDYPPTPDGVPVLGNGLEFSRDPFEAVMNWSTLDDVVRLSFPGRSLYMVTGPELIEQVLVTEQSGFTIGREQRQTFEGVEDNAVTASTGEDWERLRRALQPAFTWDGIQQHGRSIAERTAAQVAEWEDGQEFDLLREMRLLTIRILGDTLLGVDLEGDEAVLMDAADALVARADPRRFGQLLPDAVPTLVDRRFDRAVGALDEFVADVVDADPSGESTVGAALLAAYRDGHLSIEEVEDNLTALLLAGHDSSAVTLTYAWYELSRHPDVHTSIAAEVEAETEGALPGAANFENLQRTRNVVREILRLYPPTWAVNRETTRPVTVGGYEVPTGEQVMMPQWVLHRDDRFWDAPDTFDPSRWEQDSSRPEYAYFPFSGGPRHCIGMRFARLELTTALATMVTRTALDVSVEEPLTFSPSLSLRPETELTATVHVR